jgi:hypothetical protein
MSTSIAGTQISLHTDTQTPISPITPRLRHAQAATSTPGAGPSKSPRIQTRSSQAPPSPITTTSQRRSSTTKKVNEVKKEPAVGPMYLQPAEL